jgi:glycosyltransferase involved in cell wall biosynthesis
MRPILFIAPYFAPQASVGALRSVKLARRLPQLGFRPIVLAGTFPDDPRDEALNVLDGVLVRDEYLDPTLLRLRATARGRRERRPEQRGPDAALRGMDPVRAPIDRYAIHAVHAARAAVRLGKQHAAEVVYASLGPYSAAPVALRAGSALGVPVVLDLRDPWALHEAGAGAASEGFRRATVARLVRAVEQACLRRASHVILNTRGALDAYRAAYPVLSSRSSCIRNCFDMDLYRPPTEPLPPPSRFRIVHLGRLRSDTPIDDLAEALRLLCADGRLRQDELELVQVGHVSAHERSVLERAGLLSSLHTIEHVPYAATLQLLRGCHLQVVLNAPSWRLRIPAKTYDYAASGMPVLAVSPNGELDELLRGPAASYARAAPGDVQRIAAVLGDHVDRFRASGRLPSPLAPPEALSAEVASRALADVLERVTGSSSSAAQGPGAAGAPARHS